MTIGTQAQDGTQIEAARAAYREAQEKEARAQAFLLSIKPSSPGYDSAFHGYMAAAEATTKALDVLLAALGLELETDNRPRCPTCGDVLNPDEGGFCEGCFQDYPMHVRR